MKFMKVGILLPLAIVALGCASVDRDLGMSEVQQRTGHAITLQSQATNSDAPQVREMLEGELDADKAVSIALQNNPRVQVILAELGVARAGVIEASTIRNPMFGYESRFPSSPYRPFEITLAQSLIELIQLPRRRQLGRLQFDAATLRVSAETLRFAAEVREAYYGHLAARQGLQAARLTADAGRAAVEIAVRQHVAGNITDLDLENEQAVYEQSKLGLSRAEEQDILTGEALVRAMGLRDATLTLKMPSDFPPLPEHEMTVDQLASLVATRRLDVALAERNVTIAERALGIAPASAIGDVTVDVHRAREPDGVTTTGPGIEVPIPIFNRGQAARARAEAALMGNRQRLSEVLAMASSEVRASAARLTAARARVEYYRDVVLPRRSRIVELTKLEHNSMLVGVYQLLQARQNEADARREYVEAQRDYWSARTTVEAVLNGTGMTSPDMSMSSLDRGTSAGLRQRDH